MVWVGQDKIPFKPHLQIERNLIWSQTIEDLVQPATDCFLLILIKQLEQMVMDSPERSLIDFYLSID